LTAERALTIGLVNNMPDAALKATERQFRALLAEAAGARRVELRQFALPGVPRGPEGRAYLDRHSAPIADLCDTGVDGLIVTGAEPCAAALEDEPYWPALAALVEWAERHTLSTIWSCLAAHAAVLDRDGIARRPLGRKLVGLFDCGLGGDDALLEGMPRSWRVPHSRCNGLDAEALRAHGYRLLSSSPEAGVDMFARDRGSLFLFLHGHPEYEAGALCREYRRDVARFLAGERASYPELPERYFDPAAAARLAAFREGAEAEPDMALLAHFPPAPPPAPVWREPARRLYANWLSLLARRRNAWRAPERLATA
jgi:homoserine O-succinyltransferase/O-acetyltransferase